MALSPDEEDEREETEEERERDGDGVGEREDMLDDGRVREDSSKYSCMCGESGARLFRVM